jgi:hypothetical protein
MLSSLQGVIATGLFLLGLVLGLAGGKLIWKPVLQNPDLVNRKKEESFKSEVIHNPTTRTLERVSENRLPRIKPSDIPGKVKRIQDVDIQPVTGGFPINVEIVTSEDREGTHTTVQAQGGDVIYGQDLVIPQKLMVVKDLHWNAQILTKFNPAGREYGAMVGYEKNRLIASIGAFPAKNEYLVGIGFRW